MMKTTITLLTLSILLILGSCKEKKQTETVVTTPAVIEDTVKPEPVVKEEAPEEQPVIKKNEKYFLIAGCFEYKELADKLVDKLQGEAYEAKIIPYFENLYLVSYSGFETRAEAQTALNELKKEKGKEKTWIYKAGK